jgi:3-dehydroquinate synthase
MSIQVEVKASRHYTVQIGEGMLDAAGVLLREKTDARTVCIVSGVRVDALYGDRLGRALEAAGFRALRFVHPSGEEHKNLETYGKLLGFLAGHGLSRSDLLVSLGGGVTGDLTGFAAATYMRGLDYVQIPTSLLAMVDSSVGGKTAVDLPEGKNLAGCFWQPLAVLCDPALLRTLPEEELRCGAAEVVKTAVLRDEALFRALEQGGLAAASTADTIARCVSIKRDLVEEDEFDRGSRKLLNLGHSFGHALELCSGYALRHGQAVAAGMSMIARASAEKGICSRETAEKLRALLEKLGLPTETEIPAHALLAALLRDKKRSGDAMDLVLPEAIGRCRVERVPVSALENWLRLGGAK